MVTMIDEIFDRTYQRRRSELNAAIGHGLQERRQSRRRCFRGLNRIEYSAPWTASTKAARFR